MIRRYFEIKRNHPELDDNYGMLTDDQKIVRDLDSVDRLCDSIVTSADKESKRVCNDVVMNLNSTLSKTEMLLNTSLNLNKYITDQTKDKILDCFLKFDKTESFKMLKKFLLNSEPTKMNLVRILNNLSKYYPKASVLASFLNRFDQNMDSTDLKAIERKITKAVVDIYNLWTINFRKEVEDNAYFEIENLSTSKSGLTTFVLVTTAEGFKSQDIIEDFLWIEDGKLFMDFSER